MKTSIALIALTVATLSGAASFTASAATAQASLFDQAAATTPTTIWSTGELGYIQNPNGAVKAVVDAPKAMGAFNSTSDVAAKTSASTVWTFGEVGYVQNPSYVAMRDGLATSAVSSRAIAVQASVKSFKDITKIL